MKTTLLAVAAFFFLLANAAIAAPLEAYGRLPDMDDVRISPDGKNLAFTTLVDGQPRIIVQDLATRNTVGRASVGDFKVRGLIWADNDNLIIISSRTTGLRGVKSTTFKNEYSQGAVLTLSDRKIRPLLYEGAAEALLVLHGIPVVRKINGVTQVFVQSVAFVENYGRTSLFRTDLSRLRTTLVQAGEPNTDDFLVDRDGVIVGQTDYFETTDVTKLKIRQKGLLRTVDLPEGAESPSLMGLGRDGNAVLIGYYRDEKFFIAEVDPATLEWTKPLTDEIIDGTLVDSQTGSIIGFAALIGEDLKYTFFDSANQKAWDSVRAAYKGEFVRLVSWSANRRRIIVQVDSPTEGPAYALVDLDAKTADWLALVYAGLNTTDISPVKPIAYKAADGTAITGYLTLPNGKQAKNLPLVVLPHGGPASRDAPGFDWWSQALASRGYAVLQPNFRGSDGFGQAFLEAGHGEWGKKMQTDLSDGVRHFAAEGVIDPKRVCIVGASYGGYAALAGAAIDRGVYRCAVSVAGPSDLKRMLATDRSGKGVSAFRYWKRFMGVEGVRDPDLALISPAAQAEKVDIPVLLIHGKDDTVVLYEQSQIMADALYKAGKPVEFVSLDGEDHNLSRNETRQQMLKTLVDFVEKHNPPNKPAQTVSLP